MAKKIVRLTESDLTRLIKRVIMEQSSSLIGKTANFYKDRQNTIFLGTLIIKNVRSTSEKIVLSVSDKITKTVAEILTACGESGFFTKNDYDTPFYSNNLHKELKKQYCSKSSGGVSVPKADFGQTNSPQQNTV